MTLALNCIVAHFTSKSEFDLVWIVSEKYCAFIMGTNLLHRGRQYRHRVFAL